jgi:hypothetical protein
MFRKEDRIKQIYCFPYVSMHNSDFHNEHLNQKIILIDIFRYTRFRRFVKRLCTDDDNGDGCGGSKMYRLQNFTRQLPYVSALFLYIIFPADMPYVIWNYNSHFCANMSQVSREYMNFEYE